MDHFRPSPKFVPAPRLVILAAPSGAGKTSLCQRLLKDFPSLKLSVSTTTRPPRGLEKHGVDYFFISKDEFEKKIAANDFAEFALVHENYYGTSKEFIRHTLAQNYSILLDIDIQGAKSLQKIYGEKCLLIFIEPPDLIELKNRLLARGTDSPASIEKRLNNATREIAESHFFKHRLVNHVFENTYQELKKILNHEGCV